MFLTAFEYGFVILSEETEQDTCRYRRADDTGYIRSHGVHQEVVVLVEFAADILGDTCCVRNC